MRRRGEDGQVGGVEGMVFGVLVFVFGTLLVANAWAVVDAKLATTAAAREAARTYVEAPSEGMATTSARQAALEAIAAHGRRPDRATVEPPEGRFGRCQRVTVTVSYRVPIVAVPLLGEAGSGFTVRSRHSEIVDPFRAGLPGESTCP